MMHINNQSVYHSVRLHN